MPLIVSLRERVAIHEGFHTASLLMDDLAPLLTRIDTWERQAGLTKMDWANHDPTPVVLRKTLVAIALGPIADGQHEVHEWPIDPHDWHENQTDAEQLEFLADTLHMDEVAYRYALYKAAQRTRDKRFRRLVTAISERLLKTELVLQPELIKIAREVA